MVNNAEQMSRLYYTVWPGVIVAATGVAVGILAMRWTKFRNNDRSLEVPTGVWNNDHACVLHCLASLIQALQEHMERIQLEVDAEKWNDYVDALCRKLDSVEKALLETQVASELDIGLLDRVTKVIDDELVHFLGVEPGVVSILDSCLPRRDQTWDGFLGTKGEDERRFYSDLSRAAEVEKVMYLEVQVKLIDTLLASIEELNSSLQQSRVIDVSRTGRAYMTYRMEVEIVTQRYKIVNVLFATDRAITADAEYVGRISRRTLSEQQRGIPLQYGWVEVGIPDSHVTGTFEAPAKNSREEADPSKHIVIFSVNTNLRGDLGRFLECVNEDLTIEQELGELLVYIHGYNTSHLKAVKQAAQLKYDLKFKGTIILYSWSSKGTLDGYYVDEKNIKKAAISLHLLLKSIMKEVNAPRAHILAHSMGNRALIGALYNLHDEYQEVGLCPPPRCPLSQIIFVAADEERSRFEKLVQKVYKTYQTTSEGEAANVSNTNGISSSRSVLNGTSTSSRPHLSVYCSTEDWALALSRSIHHGQRRLGDTHSLFESEAADLSGEYDVIDATGTMQGTSKLCHSYHVQSPKVIEDIRTLLAEKTLASGRTTHLQRIENCKGKSFYAFKRGFWNTAPRSSGCFG